MGSMTASQIKSGRSTPKLLHMPTSLPGRNNRRCLCLLVAPPLFSLLSMLSQVDTVAAPPPATVVSTSELALRACPTLECLVIERVPLGAGVEILEQTAETFARVAYGNVTGFANELYLATDPGHVPYLIKGEPGCQRSP